MAKGFKVVTTPPKATKKGETEFSIDEARKLIKGKAIVFCLPGRGVSYTFLKNFVQLCFECVQQGASIQISQDYSSTVSYTHLRAHETS